MQTPIFYDGEERVAIGDSILFRHSKAGELCERFPVLYRIKQGEIVGEYSTYRGMDNAFYKGTKMEKLDRECRRNTALYDVSKSIQDVVEVVGLARKKERKFVLSVQGILLHLLCKRKKF